MTVKERLLDAAYRRLSAEGIGSLQARGIAADVGLSTSALYTHYGNISGLLNAVRDRAYGEFTDALLAPGQTDDPVADLLAMGLAHRIFALVKKNEYALLFSQRVNVPRPGIKASFPEGHGLETMSPAATHAFQVLYDTTQRMLDSGRFGDADAVIVATQLWAAIHGYVSLELTGHLNPESDLGVFASLFVTQLIGLGDSPERVGMSMAKAIRRVPNGIALDPAKSA